MARTPKDETQKRRPGRPRKSAPSPVQSETTTPGPETRKGHLRVVPAPAPEGATLPPTRQRSAIDPLTGLTEKQEAFCQGVTSGMTLSDAYRSAYVTHSMTQASVHTLACKLFADVKVSSRIRAIAEEMAEKRRMLAPSDAELALSVLRKMAEKADTDASKIRAAELLAKAAGVFVEQVEMTDKSDLTEDVLEARIKARLAKVGLTGT